VETNWQGAIFKKVRSSIKKKAKHSKTTWEIKQATRDHKASKKKIHQYVSQEIITQEEHRENVEANNIEINELAEKKNDLLTAMESEQTGDNIEKLKQELLQFLNFDELTPEILHRFINRIEVKDDGTPFIHYRFSASIPD
jgi:site-specific DNA recombinase